MVEDTSSGTSPAFIKLSDLELRVLSVIVHGMDIGHLMSWADVRREM